MVTDKTKSNKYDRLLILLILSLLFGGIGGALQVPRVLTVLFSPFLLGKVRNCKFLKGIIAFFVLFVLFCIFSLLWTPDVEEGIKEILYYIIHFILFTEIVVFSRYAIAPTVSLSKSWAAVIFLLSLIVIWELVTGNHLAMAREEDLSMNLGGVITERLTVSATYGNYNGYVTFLCYAIPIVFYFIIIAESVLQRGIAAFALIMAFVSILINGSRGGLFSLVLFFGIYFIFMPKNKKTVFRTILLVAVIGFILIKYNEEIFFVLSMKSDNGGLTTDNSRMDIWNASLHLILNSGGLGVGVGGMEAALKSYSSNIIPATHNIFLEALLQYGIIPSLFFFGFLIKMLKDGLKIADKNRKVVVVMSLITLPVYGIINSNYLLGPDLYILLATLYVFTYYERIEYIY